MKHRNLVIGDIHGSAKALEQVLERCKFDPMVDKLIQIGDVADGWNEVSECVDILLDIKRKASFSSMRQDNEPVFIRGNHDVWVYDWMMFGMTPSLWTRQGGEATMASYVRTEKLEDRDHKNFWFTQEDYFIDDKNNLFIHAGWAYMDHLELLHSGMTHRELFHKQAMLPVNAGTIAKECHWDRDVLSGARSGAVGKNGRFKALEQFNQIFIGHTAISTRDGSPPQPEQSLNLWNVDTGAGWSGCLTIMDVDTHEHWQSDLSKDLYPDVKGR